MKELFLIFYFTCAIVIFSKSQILIGPAVGANLSWVSFDDKDDRSYYDVQPVPGYHAGIQVAFKVRKRFFLHTSVLYSTKGKVITSKDEPLLRNEVRYNYIDIPIVYTVDFKGKIGYSKEFKYFAGIGPNVSYWLGGKGNFTNSELVEGIFDPEQSYKIVFKQNEEDLPADKMNVADPNRIQLGLNLAVGLELEPAPRHRMALTVRYELGHSYFSKTTDGYFSRSLLYKDNLRTRNQGLRITLSYMLDLNLEDRKKGKSTIRRSKMS